MIILEATNGGGFAGLFAIIIGIMTGPAILLFVIAAFLWKKKRKIAKNLLLAGFLYLLIAGGICGIMVS